MTDLEPTPAPATPPPPPAGEARDAAAEPAPTPAAPALVADERAPAPPTAPARPDDERTPELLATAPALVAGERAPATAAPALVAGERAPGPVAGAAPVGSRARGGARLGAAVVVLACGLGATAWAARPWLARRTAAAERAARAPLTDAEVAAFAAKVEETFTRGDASFVDGRLDAPGLLARLEAAGVAADRLAPATEAMSSPFSRLLARHGPGARVKHLRARHAGDERVALFRVVGADGFDHVEMVLSRGADGGVSYDDLRLLRGGLRVSVVMARLLGAGESAADILRMSQLIQAGKGRAALQVHARMPAERQRAPAALTLVVQAALADGSVDLDEAAALVEPHARPDDPGTQVALYDLHREREDWDRALAALVALDGLLGGDPYLLALQGELFVAKGQPVTARLRAEEAARRDPSLTLPDELFLGMALDAVDHAEALRLLGVLERRGVDYGDLREQDDFAVFVTTREYLAWTARSRREEAPR